MNTEAKLVDLIRKYYMKIDHSIGYPVCQQPNLSGFGDWYAKTGLCDMHINNCGNPFDDEQFLLNSTAIEKEVIQTFAPYYGIPEGKEWGFVTNSGTDGNMHGIYFGAKILQKKTGKLPIVYISKEAHYSSARICDVQNLETRMIDFDKNGSMDIECFRKNLVKDRPALIVGAIGSTFMGATDNIKEIKKRGHKIFLDLKLHDIPNTVKKTMKVPIGFALTSLFTQNKNLINHLKRCY